MGPSAVYHWNDDKPHRCPDCHRVWTWDGIHVRSWFTPRIGGKTRFIPVGFLYKAWWRTNRCPHCGILFSGRARQEVP